MSNYITRALTRFANKAIVETLSENKAFQQFVVKTNQKVEDVQQRGFEALTDDPDLPDLTQIQDKVSKLKTESTNFWEEFKRELVETDKLK
eukprot:CAMPEP_0177640194 /NCGR_PEP_ID=MMETSP0447-20121125/6415_1 /TAXON_ID=0 /ORGANISM="Stygamoeba regulata, Strain BSH-02190019" /LENGTH=90 /DNA_ID=CAMNT_0019142253 /DNA_START=149 /DNA_END=421 /DNA_ORIENTATION=-